MFSCAFNTHINRIRKKERAILDFVIETDWFLKYVVKCQLQSATFTYPNEKQSLKMGFVFPDEHYDMHSMCLIFMIGIQFMVLLIFLLLLQSAKIIMRKCTRPHAHRYS